MRICNIVVMDPLNGIMRIAVHPILHVREIVLEEILHDVAQTNFISRYNVYVRSECVLQKIHLFRFIQVG